MILVCFYACPKGCGHYASMVIFCPSVCPVSDPKSRKEGQRKLKIGRKEAHDTGDHDPI